MVPAVWDARSFFPPLSPLLAQRAREKWGTRRPVIRTHPCAKNAQKLGHPSWCVSEKSAELCSAGQTRASVPTWFVCLFGAGTEFRDFA